MDQCRLCKKRIMLEESHIIPKFIAKWLKKTSATDYLRFMDTPNIRRQDLVKIKLLCKACEDLFSDEESYFAEKIFHPYMNRKSHNYNFSYNHQLIRFCSSISWRAIVYLTEILKNETNPEIEKYKSKLEKFLLRDISNLDQYEQHIIPLERVSQSELNIKHSNINFYFNRYIHIDLLSSENGMLIYVKLPNFIILSNINYKYINKLRGSRVSLKEGNLLNKEYRLPMEIYEYLDEKLGRIKANLNTSMSETQREKILETIKRNPNRFEESLTLKAMEADLYPYHFIK